MLSKWERQNDQPVTPNMPVSDIKRILPTANSRTQVWFFVQYHHHHRKYGIERSAPSGSTCLPIRQTVQMGQARCTSASRSSHDTIPWEYPPASQHTSSTSVCSRLILDHSRLLLFRRFTEWARTYGDVISVRFQRFLVHSVLLTTRNRSRCSIAP